MNFYQISERCPKHKFVCKALLKNFKFVYDGTSKRGGAVANIVEAKNGRVWGGLFEIDGKCLTALDKYEGFPSSYDRQNIKVNDDKGVWYDAIAYFRKGKQPGEPSSDYRKLVREGASNCELPESYIENYL